MAYIETHQSLLTHRKTLRLSRLLGIDRFAVIGRLMALWSWALDNAQEGVIEKQDSDILADIMGWPVQRTSGGHPTDVQTSSLRMPTDVPQQLIDALVESGFLDDCETHYAIHDWMDYAGKLIEKRKADAERKRRERASKPAATPAQKPSKTVPRTSGGHPTDVAGTLPNLTLPNHRGSSKGKVISSSLASDALQEPAEGEAASAPRAKTQSHQPHSAPANHAANPIWDALVDAFGPPTTKTERTNYGRVATELRDAGATAADVKRRIANHSGDWELTINALLSWWTRLDHPRKPSHPGQNGRGAVADIPVTIPRLGDN